MCVGGRGGGVGVKKKGDEDSADGESPGKSEGAVSDLEAEISKIDE